MVALIYQKRCVEGLSKEQIDKEAGLNPDKVEMFIRYYYIRKEQENLETNGEDK